MWDAILNYGQQHPRYFEPLSQYAPTAELLAVYQRHAPASAGLHRRGLWLISHPEGATLVQQGWKIHVSTAPDTAEEVLERTLPILVAHGVPFKFLLDRATLVRTSAKRWARGSSGKFITVYPGDEAEFSLVAKELANALDGIPGPFILSDRRVPGSANVFYRYGGFKAVKRLQPDGTDCLMISDPDGNDVPDIRNPFYRKPVWATDPFAEPDAPRGVPDLNNGRYAITRALTFSNAGGVYVALDKHTGDEVVIKEARPQVLVGARALDAQQMLTKEYEILRLLADTGRYVQPVELFTEWEHTFLVEKFIDGEQMSSRSIRLNPLINGDLSRANLIGYYTEQQRQWLELLAAIVEAHRIGVVLADLSFTNVLIDKADGRVVLIDLEAAIRVGRDQPIGLHTPGVSSPAATRAADAVAADDYYSFGALMLGSVMVINSAVGHHPPALAGFLVELSADLRLPSGLAEIITSLMRPSGAAVPDPELLRHQIAALDFAGHDGWSSPVPLAGTPSEPDGIPADELDRLVTGTTAQIRETADLHRADRLFPMFLLGYETNPYSVSYGAAGVLHVLQEIEGQVDGRFASWLLSGNWSDPQVCPPGLYTGTAGIAWVLDELGYHDIAIRALADAGRHPLAHVEPGVFSGTAGLGLACLRLSTRSVDPEQATSALAYALECGRRLSDTALHDERGAHWLPGPGPGRTPENERQQPIGYGTGASGIALFLLYLSQATGDPSWRELGRQALDHDLSWAWRLTAGFVEFPSHTHEPTEEPKVIRGYWDEGTAGVATALLRYRVVADDDGLRSAWTVMRPDLCRKYAVLPQLFHGLAGVGMALQDAAELLGDAEAGSAARRLARGVALFAVPREHGTAWPSEQCFRESSDLATGAAGVAMFLHRLREPATGRSSNVNFVLDELLDD